MSQTIPEFKAQVDEQISTKTNPDSIPPEIVGGNLKDLADIVDNLNAEDVGADAAGTAATAVATHVAQSDPHTQYVQKQAGKGLSQENYTTSEKNKLASLNEHYRGTFTSLAQLQSSIPTGNPGDYALVDPGSGTDTQQYNWDTQDGWVVGGGASAGTTDDLAEGTVNLYFTPERAQEAVIDDTVVSSSKTFSSQKIRDLIPVISKYSKATSAIVSYIRDRYQGFPTIAMDRDKYAFAECIWKDAPSHVADGNLKWSRSTDGFKTFTDPVTITVGGTPLTNATNGMIGFGRNGRSVIAYCTGGDLTTMYFAKCDNHTNAFTATTTMPAPSGIDWLFPFGKTIIMPGSGELRMLGYCKETAITPTSTCYFKSTDNGDSWTFGGIIAHGGNITIPSLGQTFPIGPSEADWDIIWTDGTDAGTKLFLITRDDVNYVHIQLYSNNGGNTWHNTLVDDGVFAFGFTIHGSPDAFWPCTVLCYGEKAYAIHGVRMQPSTPENFCSRVFVKDALTVYDHPSNWNAATDFYTHYRPQSYTSYGYTDWGYIWPVVNPYGQLSAVLYDGDPRGTISTTLPPTIVIKAIDLENGNYFSTYSATNQTIPTGVETEITFDKPWLDSENSGKHIPSDGNYSITFQCKIAADATGTYRQVSLYGISEGQENHVPGTGKTRYGRKVIAPSAVSQLQDVQIDCSGYFIAGTVVRPMIIHDASGNLTLDNSDPLTRATLSFKKID